MHYEIQIDKDGDTRTLGNWNSTSQRLEIMDWLNPPKKFVRDIATQDDALEYLFKLCESPQQESLLPSGIEFGIKFSLWLSNVTIQPDT